MPQPDQDNSASQVLAALEAIDATLAGEPVDPMHAELAELALLLADERPATPPQFADALDRSVRRRFAPANGGAEQRRMIPSLRRRWWLWSPAAGLAGALAAAVVIVVVGNGPPSSSSSAVRSAPAVGGSRNSSVASQPPGGATNAQSPTAAAAGSSATGAPSVAGSSSAAGVPLQPAPNGRKIIQGAQLALSTAPSRIDQVAQEVFVVIGQVRGIVNSSTVTATGGPGAYAQFQLSIPSSMLPEAMASLSTVRYATVASRTDTTQDVNDQYAADVRSLTDARALRTSLLRQLAAATTQVQIDSLTARIHDAEASISSDEATLRGLNRQVAYSQVGLTINGGALPVPVSSTSASGFGLGKAAHDAGRVLVVAAGITLIGLAALIPLTLLGALGWWAVTLANRRRRERALDLI